MNEEIQAPATLGLLGEARGLLELPSLLLQSRHLARQPKGQGQPIETPVTAIYSRNGAVVAWRACIGRYTPQVEHIEVEATHLGLKCSPRVCEIITERLARPKSATR